MKPTLDTDLTKTWTRYDFRESVFAPGISILQALTLSGKTASGTGDTREEALDRCLSETAELLAMEALQPQSGNASAAEAFHGIAAHTDATLARQTALLEAHERAAVLAWWRGDLEARPLLDAWMSQSGLSDWLEKMRRGATSRRVTRLWSLDGWGTCQVVVSRSSNEAGQDPILGFGAAETLEAAGAKALRETLEMELNLLEIMAVRSGYLDFDVDWIERKVALYRTKCRSLLGADATCAAPSVTAQLGERNVRFQELTETGQRPVWGCRFETSSLLRANETMPFMSTK